MLTYAWRRRINEISSSVCQYYYVDVPLECKTHGEKTLKELYKNFMSCYEQILEAASNKTAAKWPLISHLRNYTSKTNKT